MHAATSISFTHVARIKKKHSYECKTMYVCIAMANKKEECKEFFDQLGVEPVFIDPVLKKDIDLNALQYLGVIAPFKQWKRRAPWPAAPHEFEIACALSHMKACQVIAESGASFGFVFEDDNVISPSCVSRFKEITKWAERHTSDFLVLNISPCNSLHTGTGILTGSQGCTNALLYSRQGAQFVLKNLLPLESPIDDWLHLNVPQSYCLHRRIFCQKDSVTVPPWYAWVNPFYCKYEYALNSHLACVVTFIGAGVCSALYYIW